MEERFCEKCSENKATQKDNFTDDNAKDSYTVPRRYIIKEVQKYFDEFGSKVGELYAADETHHIKYVNRQLKSEFTYEQIEDPRTRHRIHDVFMEVWDSKMPPKSMQDICDELIEENPGANVSVLLGIFAKTYPCKKRHSRRAYQILSEMVG